MAAVNSSENAAAVSKNEVATPKSIKEPQAANCQDLDLSLNQVGPIHTNEVSIGKVSRSAISSLSKLIAGDITSYISITGDRINLTFSFPKSDFGQMSLAVLQELGKADSNKGENDKHELSKTQKSALTDGSNTSRECKTTLSGETLNRSFLSEIAYRSDVNNTEDILSAFMKESDVSNSEIDCNECPNRLETNSTECSTFLDSQDQGKQKMNSKVDNSFENSRQDSLKTPTKDALNVSLGNSNGTLTENSRIYSQGTTPKVCITDSRNSKKDDNMKVSAVSVQMTPKGRKSLELTVDPTRSLSIEFGCGATEICKENGYISKSNNDQKAKMECHVPEYSTLNSKDETGVVEDDTDDLSVCVTENSPETGKTNMIKDNSATNLKQLTRVPDSKEMSLTRIESGAIEIQVSSFNTSLEANALCDCSGRDEENGSFDGDDKQSGKLISTSNSLKSDVWPKILPFTKIYTIAAKEIKSCVSTSGVIKYFRLELPDRCIVVKATSKGVKDISVEIGEYKEQSSCNSSSEFGIDVDSEEHCNIMLEKGELSNKCVSKHTPNITQCDSTECLKKDDSSYIGRSNENTNLVSPQTGPPSDFDAIKQKISNETSCQENLSPSTSDTAPTETSFRTLGERSVSNISEGRSDGEITSGVQSTRPSEDTVLSVSDKFQRVGHTSTPSRTPKRLSLMFAANVTNNGSEKESVPGEILEDQLQKKLSFKNQSVTELSSYEFTGTISSEVSCSTFTENEPVRNESTSSSSLLAPNSTPVSTSPVSVVDNVTASSFRTSKDDIGADSGNVTPSTFMEEGVSLVNEDEAPRSPTAVEDDSLPSPSGIEDEVPLSTTAVEDEVPLSTTAVEDEVPLSTTAVEDEAPLSTTAVEDEAPLSTTAVEDEAPRSPTAVEDGALPSTSTVEDEAVSTSTAVEYEASPSSPAAVEDEAAPACEAIEDEAAPACEAIEDETLPYPPGAAEDEDSPTCEVVEDETRLSPPAAVYNEASKSPTPATKSETQYVSVVENGAEPLSQTVCAVSVEPSTPHYSESRGTAEPRSEVTLTLTEAEVNPDSSSSTLSKIRSTVVSSPDTDRLDDDHLTEQSENPSAVEGPSEEDGEIATDPPAESNEETAAENSSVTSTVEDVDTIDSESSDAIESSSSEASKNRVSNGVRSEDDSSRGAETSDKPKESSTSGAKENGDKASSTHLLKSKSSSRSKRIQRDAKRLSVDEVDLAPTRARSRNPPSSLWKDTIPENSSITGKYERHTIRTDSSAAKASSPSKRSLRSKSLDPSPTKSSSRKAVSGKPALLENEAVARIKRSESTSDRDVKPKIRSSPRKAAPLDTSKSGAAADNQSAKSRSSSLLNTRRSKRGAKD